MINLRAAFLAALFILGQATAALSQDVSLRSRDGSIELTGNLLGYDGEFYRIETRFGVMTVDGSGVLCDGVGCPSLTDYVAEVTISGSSTIGTVLMPALLEAFAARSGMTTRREPLSETSFVYHLTDRQSEKTVGRFTFDISSTAMAFVDLVADETDIAMALREIRPQERRMAQEAGLGDLAGPNRSRVLALDALVPVVSARNPISSISLKALSQVLTGEIDNWADLGGPDAPVVIHMRNAESGLTQRVEDKLLSPVSRRLGAIVERHDSNAELSQAVSRDLFGIGFASQSKIADAKALTLTGSCGFELRAARRTIKTEDYPLTAPMFLYLPPRRLPALAREFLAFTRSAPAQIVIRRAGFVDQAPEEVAIDLQGDRFANAIAVAEGETGLVALQTMVAELSAMKRLTTSFRFEPGSARLDAQSRSNVQQLARALEAGLYDQRTLLFAGFSDGLGPASANLNIARQRAEAVSAAVLSAAETADPERIDLQTNAFGEAMPLACDDNAWGRDVNRRVEVWVR